MTARTLTYYLTELSALWQCDLNPIQANFAMELLLTEAAESLSKAQYKELLLQMARAYRATAEGRVA